METQNNRYKSSVNNSRFNSDVSSREVTTLFRPSPEVRELLSAAADRLGLSARSYFKILKVARTIADMEAVPDIEPRHVAEALQYRQPDARS